MKLKSVNFKIELVILNRPRPMCACKRLKFSVELNRVEYSMILSNSVNLVLLFTGTKQHHWINADNRFKITIIIIIMNVVGHTIAGQMSIGVVVQNLFCVT